MGCSGSRTLKKNADNVKSKQIEENNIDIENQSKNI